MSSVHVLSSFTALGLGLLVVYCWLLFLLDRNHLVIKVIFQIYGEEEH